MKNYLILTGDENSHSNQRIRSEIENRGCTAEIRNPQNFVPFLSDTTGHDRLYYRTPEDDHSERLVAKNYDGIVSRIGGAVFQYGTYIARQFENLGIFVTCPAFAAENCSNKFVTAQLLSRARVSVPRQNLSWYSKNPAELLVQVDKKFPVWIKQLKGSQGVGVFQLTEPVSANQIMQSFRSIPLIIQRDLAKNKEGKRSDIRALVVGPETENPEIVAYERIAESTDTRSNFSIHKSGKPIELDPTEKDMVIRAANAMGCGIAGVDLIRDEQKGSPTEGKTFVIEVNSNVGLTGIEEVTGKNCAGIIAEYVIRESDRKSPNQPFYDRWAANGASPKNTENEPKITDIQFNNQKLETMTKSEKMSKQNAEIDELFARAEKLDRKIEQNSNRLNKNLQNLEKQEFEEFNRRLWEDDPKNKLLHDLEEVRDLYN